MGKKLNIGLFGFGVVGQGLYDISVSKNLNFEFKKIAIKDPSKKRTLPESLFTTDKEEILNDPEINTIIELINDAEAAYEIVTEALKKGKNVVSANKKMIAIHLKELVAFQEEYGTSLLYEGSVCGSIPIIRNLEEYYDNELLFAISGIFNGSSNYILSKVFNENQSYDSALKKAQDLGFAETNPILDVGGYDPKFKVAIAAAHAYGIFVNPDDILNIGIQNLNNNDLKYAREKGQKIKLVPIAKKLNEATVGIYVLPKLVSKDDFLFNVENEYNGVSVQAAFADQQFFFGKGAGGHPTGAAVFSDISALRYDYKYEYKKAKQNLGLSLDNNVGIEVYFRFNSAELLKEINFNDVSESYNSKNYNYVVGTLTIAELIAKKEIILNDGAFVAETGKREVNH
ncbi:homoserine dehydrogenase [Pseudopedobacter saltans DSM 12145]|uniref:Homoserine dehydrogenase n=1 Tax=Pseudopedobacter saltans (strain ATCC 51119 / DSM 12145 / JCM 21818 / CCUG 39354 / LMG 10337 / NBRC 100064 / NCIMB 13643) TaxID=762903 RepID=F0SCC9_PSESL|nr:homoserine dehydrogenase [Pseudopedobacter saltans]ADY51726.1 homoserine dehydrogenase [Pseudopedobacter saltans DSM 12145]